MNDENIVVRIVNAWDCCGTCAGGVLAQYVREAKAEAWSQGWVVGNRWAFSDADADAIKTNPYRAALDGDCRAVGFSGEGRCIEPAVRDGLCAGHLDGGEDRV